MNNCRLSNVRCVLFCSCLLVFRDFESFEFFTSDVALIAFLMSLFFRRWHNKIWPWGFCLPCSCYHARSVTAEPDSDSPYSSAAIPQSDPAPGVQLHWVTLLCWCARCSECIPIWANHVCKCDSLNCNPPCVPLWFLLSSAQTFYILESQDGLGWNGP